MSFIPKVRISDKEMELLIPKIEKGFVNLRYNEPYLCTELRRKK